MKKLIAMIGAVALGAFAWADDVSTYTGTDFEAYTAGEATTQTEDNLYYWLPSADAEATATVVEGESTGTAIGEWSEGNDQKVLTIKTNLAKPLYRSVLGGGSALSALSGKSMDDVVYFDAMVKFTACDEPVEIVEGKLASDAQAKLAVYVREDEEAGETNLFVTAGYYDGETMVATNYDCGPVTSYIESLDAFQRLTIRTIKEISNNGAEIPGFVVFVNENKVVCNELRGAIALNKEAAAFNKNGNGLFPSIDIVGGDKANICGVGFAGQGSVDDITFAQSDDSREFAIPPKADELIVTFVPGDVTALTLETSDGNTATADAAALEAGQLAVEVTADSSPIKVTATYASGKKAAYDWTEVVNCTVDAEKSPAEVTIDSEWESGDDLSCAIATMSSYNGVTIAGRTYPTIEEAFAYLNSDLKDSPDPVGIQLQNDLTVADGNMLIVGDLDFASVDVVLDLNGKTLTGPDYDESTAFTVVGMAGTGKLTITDSSTGGKIVADAENGQAAVSAGSGTLEILNGIFDGRVDVDDESMDGCTISGGSFDAVNNSTKDDPAEFTLADYVPADKVASSEVTSGYWTIVPYVAPDFEGEGTENDPYLIKTVADLEKLQTRVAEGTTYAGKYFQQTATIDFEDEDPWAGIGNKAGTQFFAGIYDGNGQRIENVTFDAAAGSYVGFFRYVKDGTIKDLTVEANGFGNVPTELFGGSVEYGGAAVVGTAADATLTGLTAEGQLGTMDAPLTHNGGGICVKMIGGTISYCTNKLSVVCAYSKVAGICVFDNVSSTMSNKIEYCVNDASAVFTGITCYTNALGKAAAKGDEGAVLYKAVASDGFGGIIAWIGDKEDKTIVNNCESYGTMSVDADATSAFLGGIIGEISYGVAGEGNKCAKELPLVGAIACAKTWTDFWYESIQGDVATQDKAALAADQTRVIAVGCEKDKKSTQLPKPALQLASAETITFITNLCATAVDFSGIAVLDGAKDELKVDVVENGVMFTATALPPPGPTPVDPSEGTVVPDPSDGSFIVTPAEDKTSVELQGANKDMTIKVTTSADFVISGLNGATVKVMCNGVDIAGVCLGGQDGNFSTALDPEKTTPTFTEGESGEEPLVIGDNVGVTVTSVEGLAYTLVRGEEVGTIATPVTTIKGTGDAITLEDANKPAGKAFYKVSVSKAELN